MWLEAGYGCLFGFVYTDELVNDETQPMMDLIFETLASYNRDFSASNVIIMRLRVSAEHAQYSALESFSLMVNKNRNFKFCAITRCT